MTTTTTTAAEQLAELQRRLLDGDTSVTPAALAKARQAADHSALLAEAVDLQAERDAAAKLQAERDAFRTGQLADLDGDLAALRDCHTELVAKLGEFAARAEAYKTSAHSARASASALGIGEQFEENHAKARTLTVDRELTSAINESAGRPLTSGSGVRKFVVRRFLHSDAHHAALAAALEEYQAPRREKADAREREHAEQRRLAQQRREERLAREAEISERQGPV